MTRTKKQSKASNVYEISPWHNYSRDECSYNVFKDNEQIVILEVIKHPEGWEYRIGINIPNRKEGKVDVSASYFKTKKLAQKLAVELLNFYMRQILPKGIVKDWLLE